MFAKSPDFDGRYELLEKILSKIPDEPYSVNLRLERFDVSSIIEQFRNRINDIGISNTEIEIYHGITYINIKNATKEVILGIYKKYMEVTKTMINKSDEEINKIQRFVFEEANWHLHDGTQIGLRPGYIRIEYKNFGEYINDISKCLFGTGWGFETRMDTRRD